MVIIRTVPREQWLSGRVLDWRPRGRKKTCPYITERLLMGVKNQSKQTKRTVSSHIKIILSLLVDVSY